MRISHLLFVCARLSRFDKPQGIEYAEFGDRDRADGHHVGILLLGQRRVDVGGGVGITHTVEGIKGGLQSMGSQGVGHD